MTEPRNPPRFRVSLTTLVLLTTITGMALVIWRLAPLRKEVQRLRNEAGYLTIEDEMKVHAIAVETESPLVWKWKVHIPKGKKEVRLGAKVGEIPAADSDADTSASIVLTKQGGYEAQVVVRVYRNLQGMWLCETTLGGTSSRQELTKDQVESLREPGGWSNSGVGRSTVVLDSKGPQILMRRRFVSREKAADPGINFRTHGLAGPGVIVWIETRP